MVPQHASTNSCNSDELDRCVLAHSGTSVLDPACRLITGSACDATSARLLLKFTHKQCKEAYHQRAAHFGLWIHNTRSAKAQRCPCGLVKSIRLVKVPMPVRCSSIFGKPTSAS